MKKITFFVFATALWFTAAAQPRKWNKKPMSDFRNDTVEYIRQNFNPDDKNMQEYFKDKTIGEIIPELGFKVKYVSACGVKHIPCLMLVAIGRGNRNGEFETTNGVWIRLETPVSSQDNPAAYDKLMSKPCVPLDKELLDLIKNMKVNYIEETETELM